MNKHVIQIYNKFFSVEKFGSGKHVLINSYTCFAPVFILRSCLIRRMINFKSFAEHLKQNKDRKKNKKNLHLYMSKTRYAQLMHQSILTKMSKSIKQNIKN